MKLEAMEILSVLEDARIHLELQEVWTTLIVAVAEQAEVVFGRMLR